MLETVIRVIAADTPLKLESVWDGVVELPATGMASIDNLQSVWVGSHRVFGGEFRLCIESVSQFAQLGGVVREIRHIELRSGRLGA
ncbi:hypothetical protein ACWGJ2_40435 [Streptomyces sp. NPDC054796]